MNSTTTTEILLVFILVMSQIKTVTSGDKQEGIVFSKNFVGIGYRSQINTLNPWHKSTFYIFLQGIPTKLIQHSSEYRIVFISCELLLFR